MKSNTPPAPQPVAVGHGTHLKNLRNFVEQFIVERDGLTGETVLRVADMPVSCGEMSLVLLAVTLAEKERAELLAALKEIKHMAKCCGQMGSPLDPDRLAAMCDAALAQATEGKA